MRLLASLGNYACTFKNNVTCMRYVLSCQPRVALTYNFVNNGKVKFILYILLELTLIDRSLVY